jgi:uncharacterized damage-inducible protein DinB
MDLLDRLLEHDRWATDQLLELAGNLTDAQLDQEFDVGHRTLRETFEHMIFNVEAWTAVMAGQPIDRRRDGRSLPALVDRHRRSFDAFAALARRLRDEQRLDETFTDSYGEPMRFGGAIVHVVLHDEGHRLEALHILSRLGVPDLPELDHALWDHVSRGALPSAGPN